jgi:hypothetical protein
LGALVLAGVAANGVVDEGFGVALVGAGALGAAAFAAKAPGFCEAMAAALVAAFAGALVVGCCKAPGFWFAAGAGVCGLVTAAGAAAVGG